MHDHLVFRVILALGAILAQGCSDRPEFPLGGDCELTTDCAAPLVCRLGRCREECRDDRDCRVGLVCLRDPGSLGACELEDEGCTLSTDCPDTLVCLMGRCTNECATEDDCPPGAHCEVDDAGVGGCRDDFMMDECDYHSDCDRPLICTPDHQCREPCQGDRDCRDGTVCDESMSPRLCVLPSTLPDGGPADGGASDGGVGDGGIGDGGMSDGGVDGGMAVAPAPVPALAAGFIHTCATRGGQLFCWGSGARGQIGDGMLVDRPLPVPVTAIAAPSIVAAGAGHTCALATGGVWCWGDNALGQVGDGTATAIRPSPVATGIATASWLAAASDHSCALVGGEVRCWGDNAMGQLGDGTTTPHRAPMPTSALAAAAVEITARGRHTCARLADGTLQCWGENRYGQLGNGTSTTATTPTPAPQAVLDVTDAVEVIAGSTHTCARRSDGSVWCWGSNLVHQLGDGTTVSRDRAGIVPGLPAIAELAGGLDHVCARDVSGGVHCWGGNNLGQGGLDPDSSPFASRIPMPRAVPGIAGATELTAGDAHTCARIGADVVRCWGQNGSGQLGDGTMTNSFSPTTVSFP